MLRRARSARPVVLFVGISVFLLWFAAVGWAPNTGSTETLAVPAASPDPAHDPPRLADLTDLPLPRVRAQAAIVYNPATHEILWESNGHQPRPIASITKVMTVLVFLEQEPDLDAEVVVSRRDVRRANTTYLRRGERITLRNLLHLSLMASDNAAARVLARVSPWGTVGFVEQMNLKAEELGLRSTSFADPSGLHASNESTAYDLSRLIAHATTEDRITSIMRKRSYRMRTSRRRLTVRNTNRLLEGRLVVYAGKTGYTDASGYCLAAVVKIEGSDPVAVVVLGASSNARRFSEVRRLADWVSKNGPWLIGPAIEAD